MANYVVQQEDGTSKITLEDGSGFVLLEEQPVGTPRRVSQEPVEVLISPTDGKGRISQEPVEVLVLPTDAKARVSQLAVEVIQRVLHEDMNFTIIDYLPDG